MKIYIIFSTATILGLVFFCVYLFHRQQTIQQQQASNQQSNIDDNRANGEFDWKIKWSLILAALLVFIAGISPLLFTSKAMSKDFDFTQTGQIGDTIGGLTNPFIALAGVIITGLAFYIQYKANKQQLQLFHQEQETNKNQLQDQIDNQNKNNRIQQFESQFYEMLRLHRENVTEMEIEGYNYKEVLNAPLERYEKFTRGRKVFVVMKTELECIFAAYASNGLNDETVKKSYKLFFSGLDNFKEKFPQEKQIVDLLMNARRKHEEPQLLETPVTTNIERKRFLPTAHLYFNYKPFAGHASRLGHYFRHLYLTVKSVATNDIITEYADRMRYLRILRAQLSNHEQILLFYNWLGGYGVSWENDEHHFFTEYCMIHNLWYDTLYHDPFILKNVNKLRKKPVKYRTGPMFEIG